MPSRKDLDELHALTAWDNLNFRAGLRRLEDGTRRDAQAFAADMCELAKLVEGIPRLDGDERGASPWTSLRREVAVARRCSHRAAARDIDLAVQLCRSMQNTLRLLEQGVLPVVRAKALLAACAHTTDEITLEIDLELAERAAGLPPWRITQEVRRTILELDADAAANRQARATASRGVAFEALEDGQAVIEISGPALPAARFYRTLDARARGLKAEGDERTVDNLRFDLVTATYPCAGHSPSQPPAADEAAPGQRPPGQPEPDETDQAPAPFPPAAPPVPPCVPHESSNHEADPAVDTATTAPASESTPTAQQPPADADPHPDVPVDPAAGDDPFGLAAYALLQADRHRAAPALQPHGLDLPVADCRRVRPVQAMIVVPMTTALGLSSEPAWLRGYGWICAPSTRTLLTQASLRQVCADEHTGQLLDIAPHDVRPPPTPTAVHDVLLDWVRSPFSTTVLPSQTSPGHDPPRALADFVRLRDRYDDGPTGARITAEASDLDHDQAWPDGPTAAWNLAARSRRTHLLKHFGWIPERTPTEMIWTSPAGQVTRAPSWTRPASGIDPDGDTAWNDVRLPEPDELARIDAELTRPPGPGDVPPFPEPPHRPRGRPDPAPADPDEEPGEIAMDDDAPSYDPENPPF